MKKIFLVSCIVAVWLFACKKSNDVSGVAGRFEIVHNKCSVHGNMVTNIPLTDSNYYILTYKNAAPNTKASIISDTVNGMYLQAGNIDLNGNAAANIKMMGKPLADGTFMLSVKLTIDGTVYVCNTEFYVDEPNYTAITLTIADTAYYNILSLTSIPFKITPKTTTFTLALPAHLTADITNVAGSDRLLNVTPDAQFVKGDIVITATFMNLPTITKTLHFTAFAAGDGSTAKPFEIPDSARLNRIQYALDQSYKLTADIIQTSSVTTSSIFKGTLDGNGKKVSNCTINTATTNQVGYFSDIAAGAVVKNITFNNATITGQDYTGVVAAMNHGTVTNVTTIGTVKGRTYVGGIVGNNFGTISSCDITNMNVTGTNNLGSLAGNTNSGSSEVSNVVLTVPANFLTEVYSVTAPQTINVPFTPSDGVVVVQSAPTNLTAATVSGQQKVTLTPSTGFISGNLQLNLQKNKLVAPRSIAIYYQAQGAVFAGGDGTAGNPYLIPTAVALDAVRNDPTKNYKIIADIPLTTAWTPIPAFSGSIDGQGYKVTGMTINSTTANDGFINTNTGTLKNIQFLNVNCTTNAAFGVITGKNNGGTLQNLTVSGTVTSTNTGDVLGGVAGELATAGKVTQCYAKLNMTSSSGMVGGIVGRLTTAATGVAEISYCTSAGSIVITAAKNRVGGILGRAEGTAVGGGIVKNCSSLMAISSSGTNAGSANGMGGIFGADQNAGIVPLDQCSFSGSIVTGFSIGGIAGVGSTITNCIVAGTTATPVLLNSNGSTPATGSVAGIAGTNKVSLNKCVVKNVSLRAAASLATLPLGGIVSTYQNGGYSTNSVVINTTIEGATTAPNAVNVFRIAGTAGTAPGNSANYVGPNVTAQYRTPTTPFVDDATGLDGAFTSTLTQTFLQGLGYDFTNIWKLDTDGYPTLRNAGYNGSLPIPL